MKPGKGSGTQQEEREYLRWLGAVEQRSVLPLKWAILIVTLVIWLWSENWELPSPKVFTLFFLYFMCNATESYFLYLHRLEGRQLKPVYTASYVIDIIFVTVLIFFDLMRTPGSGMGSDFYIFYFLLILRGFALFRTYWEGLLAGMMLSIFFLITLRVQQPDFSFVLQRQVVVKLVLIWMVLLMSWFSWHVLNRQKAELLQIRQRLWNAEHLASLGEMATTVAHEINNPLSIISAYSELLASQQQLPDEIQEDLEVIQRESQRCKRILGELLGFIHPGFKELKPHSLQELSDELLGIIFPHQKEGRISIVKRYDPEPLMVLVDYEKFKQALMNIYLNAKQALPPEHATLEVTVKGENNWALMEIKDNGKGIDPELLKQVFEPFFSTKEGGTGLGLYVTQRIIEAHAGQLRITANRPQGTCVDVRLPLHKGS